MLRSALTSTTSARHSRKTQPRPRAIPLSFARRGRQLSIALRAHLASSFSVQLPGSFPWAHAMFMGFPGLETSPSWAKPIPPSHQHLHPVSLFALCCLFRYRPHQADDASASDVYLFTSGSSVIVFNPTRLLLSRHKPPGERRNSSLPLPSLSLSLCLSVSLLYLRDISLGSSCFYHHHHILLLITTPLTRLDYCFIKTPFSVTYTKLPIGRKSPAEIPQTSRNLPAQWPEKQ